MNEYERLKKIAMREATSSEEYEQMMKAIVEYLRE